MLRPWVECCPLWILGGSRTSRDGSGTGWITQSPEAATKRSVSDEFAKIKCVQTPDAAGGGSPSPIHPDDVDGGSPSPKRKLSDFPLLLRPNHFSICCFYLFDSMNTNNKNKKLYNCIKQHPFGVVCLHEQVNSLPKCKMSNGWWHNMIQKIVKNITDLSVCGGRNVNSKYVLPNKEFT